MASGSRGRAAPPHSSRSSKPPSAAVSWSVISPLGPTLAFHAGAVLSGVLYVHGGISKKGSTSPCRALHRVELGSEGGVWREVQAPGSPALSHHTCVVLQERYLAFIGGWDGHSRSAEVHLYDVQEECWIHPQVTGFPSGAGLSSHSASLLSDGRILLIGREGGLRTQRRHGNCYTLTVDVASGRCHYDPSPLTVASRSGHTAHIMGSRLYVVGGRDDQLIERHSDFRAPSSASSPLMSKLKTLTASLCPATKLPGGRKHHVSVCGAGSLFVHGGETFDGRSREPVGEMFLFLFQPEVSWYSLGTSVPRAGHLCCQSGDTVLIHGGEGARGVIYGDLHQLAL